MTDTRIRGRRQFLLLAVLFFAPLAAAVVLYFFVPQWQPEGHTNYGELVHPARPVPALALRDVQGQPADEHALRGRWSYVYVGAESCDVECGLKLQQIRQVRTLLNEKRLRVQRVYLAPDLAAAQTAHAALQAEHPDLLVLAEPEAVPGLGAFLTEPGAASGIGAHSLYLIDPLGNWMMVYPAAAESTGLLKDIKRLLRVSQIG